MAVVFEQNQVGSGGSIPNARIESTRSQRVVTSEWSNYVCRTMISVLQHFSRQLGAVAVLVELPMSLFPE